LLTCPRSLSEWGCITNGRDFGEVGALMNSEMTSVYSGGLLYEYSEEGNNFGIVTIDSSGTVNEEPEFAKFAAALSKFPAPSGNGGAASTTHAVACPTKDSVWEVDPSLIPVFPSDAAKYMQSGAGAGPGLTGDGSQNAGPATASLSTGGTASPTNSKSAAGGLSGPGPLEKGPLVVGALALVFTLVGTMVL